MQLTLLNLFRTEEIRISRLGIQFLTLKAFTIDQKKHNNNEPKWEMYPTHNDDDDYFVGNTQS
jgi:hypothetical protein